MSSIHQHSVLYADSEDFEVLLKILKLFAHINALGKHLKFKEDASRRRCKRLSCKDSLVESNALRASPDETTKIFAQENFVCTNTPRDLQVFEFF